MTLALFEECLSKCVNSDNREELFRIWNQFPELAAIYSKRNDTEMYSEQTILSMIP